MRIAKWKMPGLCRCCPVSADRRHRIAPCSAHAGSVALIAAVLILGGCAAPRPAPVTDRLPPAKTAAKPAAPPVRVAPSRDPQRPEFYTVRQGDTLYSIALEFGLDYRELAAWNNIDPARINVGQQLRLAPVQGAVASPLRSAPGAVEAQPLGSTPRGAAAGVRTEPRGVRVPYTDKTYAQMAGAKPEAAAPAAPKPESPAPAKPAAAAGADDIDWSWPVSGKVINAFNEASNKGIGISGKLGQPIVAAAPGRVIFSGTGIRGLGKLVVIKHNEQFLSVYAHNRELLVKEGQSVTRGQRIAEMGNTDTDQVKLHFEIRRFGKPVDPAGLLPPA